MAEKSHAEIERLTDLLAEKSIFGLSRAQEEELRELQDGLGPVDENTFDLAVAAFDLAFGWRNVLTMPSHVRERILSQAAVHLPVVPAQPSHAQPNEADVNEPRTRPRLGSSAKPPLSAPFTWREALFVFVAAASIIIALFAWRVGIQTSPPIISAADQRAAMLSAGQQDLVQVQWKPSADEQGQPHPVGAQIGGDVIWSDSQQQGFMHFVGLPANNSAEQQYQLWIFDAERDPRYPVDGGVFDMESTAKEIVIPIEAKIHVAKATLFAITIEKPGGVVVSDRQRLPVLAQVEK